MLRQRKLTSSTSKHSHRHAPKQETITAKRLGATKVPRSGAGDVKGDVRLERIVRIECKCTKHNSFSITKNMLHKIEEAALSSGEFPAIEVQFLDGGGKVINSVAVIPTHALDTVIAHDLDGKNTKT